MTTEPATSRPSCDPTTWGASVPVAIRITGTSTWNRYTYQDDSWTHCGIGLSAHPVRGYIHDMPAADRCKMCWPVA